MKPTKIFKEIFPLEILNLIQSYLVDDEVNKIEKIKLICRECGKEYFGDNHIIEKDNDLCPCYITWLYFSKDYENPCMR